MFLCGFVQVPWEVKPGTSGRTVSAFSSPFLMNCKGEENEDKVIKGFDLKWIGFPPILSGEMNFVGEKKETIFKYWNTSCVSMPKIMYLLIEQIKCTTMCLNNRCFAIGQYLK